MTARSIMSILIPVSNEERFIRPVVQQVVIAPFEKRKVGRGPVKIEHRRSR